MESTSEAEVRVIIDNLKELAARNSDLIPMDGSVRDLCADLEMLKIIIRKQAERQNNKGDLEKMACNIRELAREAEDAIETFLVEECRQRTRATLRKFLHRGVHKLELLAKMNEIRAKANQICQSYERVGVERQNSERTTSIIRERGRRTEVVDEDMVGCEDQVKEIIKLLILETEQLEVISITGMLGLGKTTLARKVFNDPRIEYQFFVRVFVNVSQECKRKKIFLQILSAISHVTDQVSEMPDTELAKLIHESLEKRTFLIVLDDVWTTEAWNDLNVAFPLKNQRRSRILMTTENTTVASRTGSTHQLRFLYPNESRELLRRRVFGGNKCPVELENYETAILDKCNGLPLAIIVVAGTLLNRRHDKNWWKGVADGVIVEEGFSRTEVIRVSFNQLPQHLKLCFLYLGVFREGFAVPARTILQLWMAEGLIQEDSHNCLEDVAAEYLEELVDRNLVMVEKKRSDGRIKECTIHDTLHEFCKEEAKKENLFQDTKHSSLDDSRRISINSNVGEFLRSMPNAKRVRSFLSFSKEDFICPLEYISSIPKAFRLLRVLDVRSIRLTRFPPGLCDLFLLRYIAISCEVPLPASISTLRNLQTLIVLTTERRTLEIKADISKMPLLRHLYSNASIYFQKIKGEPSANKNLQTLSTISLDSCGEEIFQMSPNLKKLGLCGNLSTIMDGNLFECLLRLEHLENLKLLNDNISCKLHSLPHENEFPRKLTSLTLSKTCLDWKHMSTLGKLEYLEVLKLKDNAFEGAFWETEDGSFQRLKVMHIGATNLAGWHASEDHFPKLVSLFLKGCTKLRTLPHGLADMPCLQSIDLYCCHPQLATSAKKISMLKHDLGETFKLCIYPPAQ